MADNTNRDNVDRIYINLHKAFCGQWHDTINDEVKNSMRVPPGTVLNGTDIGGAKFYPRYMNENNRNPDLMTATYYEADDKTAMEKINKDGWFKWVPARDLKEAIDTQRQQYAEAHREEQAKKEVSQEQTKEKDRGAELE